MGSHVITGGPSHTKDSGGLLSAAGILLFVVGFRGAFRMSRWSTPRVCGERGLHSIVTLSCMRRAFPCVGTPEDLNTAICHPLVVLLRISPHSSTFRTFFACSPSV